MVDSVDVHLGGFAFLSQSQRSIAEQLGEKRIIDLHQKTGVDNRPVFFMHRRCKRSEEHTSELQSHVNLVCRLLLEKKKKQNNSRPHQTNSFEYIAHLHPRPLHLCISPS